MLHIVKDHAHLWRPKALKGIALLKARFKDFVYSKHVHEEFGIGVIEQGTQKFQYYGETHFAPPQAIITVNPDMVHDGETATETGYQYRVAYVPIDFIHEILSEISDSTGSLRYFRDPVTFDPEVSQRLLHALWLFDQHPHDLLEAQSCFIQAIADLYIRHAQPHYAPKPLKHNPAIIRKACELIRARATENLSLEEIAREVGLSRFHFLRLFKAFTGLSPHAYLLLRRLELVKALIEQGYPLVQTAYEAGFADQSHMTRRFKSAYGITPGQYQQALFK
jgi:AraC-like DNA-binding protein